MGLFDFRSTRDWKRLQAKYPPLQDYAQLAGPIRELLAPHHRTYVSSVSTEDVVASLETCVFLYAMCDILNPSRIADLGSGFSSFMFRAWAKNSGRSAEVWSVDDSDEWLDATRDYLTGEGVSSENVISWEEFTADGRGHFDLVFHDISSKIAFRIAALPKAMELASPGGVVVLDDVHKKKKYQTFLRRTLAEAGEDYYDLKSLLKDRYGRYAWLVIRP